jgi:hypothetical protein
MATAPTVTAVLTDGPLRGETVAVELVEGRPPKTLDVGPRNGTTYRYCLARWTQRGPEARYTFLYPV